MTAIKTVLQMASINTCTDYHDINSNVLQMMTSIKMFTVSITPDKVVIIFAIWILLK